MNRNTIILLAVVAALGIGGFIWWRRRENTRLMSFGATAITPSPQANLAALQAPGAPFGLTGTAGQVANVVAGLLPPIGAGTTAAIMPQSTPVANPPAATAAGINCADPQWATSDTCRSKGAFGTGGLAALLASGNFVYS